MELAGIQATYSKNENTFRIYKLSSKTFGKWRCHIFAVQFSYVLELKLGTDVVRDRTARWEKDSQRKLGKPASQPAGRPGNS